MTQQMNHNHLITQDFKIVIPGLEHLNYFIQRAPLPGMHQMAVESGYQNNKVKTPGETIMYDPLTVDFLVDEIGENHYSLQEWMRQHHSHERPYEKMRDITLHIFNRNKNANVEYTFYGAFPTDVEQLSFDSTLGGTDPVMCSATFAYQYYTMTKRP